MATRSITTDPNTNQQVTNTSYANGYEPVQLTNKQTKRVNQANIDTTINSNPVYVSELAAKKEAARLQVDLNKGTRRGKTSAYNTQQEVEVLTDEKGSYIVVNGVKKYLQE